MKNKKDIAQFSKKTPFQVPDKYFDELPHIIESRIAEEEAVWNESKEAPFTVPDRYFDELPLKIQQQIQTESKVRTLALPQTRWAWIPAAIVIAIAGYLIWPQTNPTSNTDDLIAQVETEDLIAYLEMSDLSTEEIIETIDFENIEIENNEPNMLDELKLTDDELEDIFLEYEINAEG